MTTPLTAGVATPLADVVTLMPAKHVKRTLVGMVSRSDLLRHLAVETVPGVTAMRDHTSWVEPYSGMTDAP